MLNIIRESFKITNSNIIIATPLIFFSLISSLYLIFSSGGTQFGLIFSGVLFFFMIGAFLSGWFMMITKAIKSPEIEDNKLITEFPSGVGIYFLPILVMIVIIFIISSIILIAAVIAGKKFIGGIGVPASEFGQALASIDTMKTFINSLTQEQLVKINAWNMLFFFTMIFNYFILMFYPAAIFFKKKNPFIAFYFSLKDTFGHKFFKNIALFLIIFVSYMILSALIVFLGKNIIVHFVLTLVNFYYMTYIGILIFNYYYSNFAKIGSNIDTTV